MSYQLFYWIHVVSTIIWLTGFVASLYYALKAGNEQNAAHRRRLMQAERKATGIGAHLGALGILISGGVLVSVSTGPQWGWFNIALYPWLVLKQILFIIMLVLIGLSIKRSMDFKRHLRREVDVINSETTDMWRKAYRISFSVYILVVVNTILALTKPL